MSETTVKQEDDGWDGYIIDIFDGSAWLTRDLKMTPNWNERGIWTTSEEAKAAMNQALTCDEVRKGKV